MSFFSNQKNAPGKTLPKEQEQVETEREIEQIEMHPPRESQLKEKERVETKTKEREPIELRPRGGRNNDPRRLRLLARLTNAPLGIGRGMERKIAFENENFEQRNAPPEGVPINKGRRRKMAFEDEQFELRKAPESPPPGRRPPAPPTLPVLPDNPADKILVIREASIAAQDSLRRASDQLSAVKGDFTEPQAKRTRGEDAEGATKAMTRILDGIQGVLDGCDTELTRLTQLRDLLAQVQINLLGTPPAVPPLHQKVTGELAARIIQAQAVCDAGRDLATKLESARDGKSSFKITDAMPSYVPTPTEIPSLLRDLTTRLKELTPAFQDATRQLTPLAQEVAGLYDLAVKGRPVPNGTAGRLDQIAQQAGAITRPFSQWNKGTVNPYRQVTGMMEQLVKPIDPEIAELSWRMKAAYDPFTRAFSDASQTEQKIGHLTAQLRLCLAPPPGNTEAAIGELSALSERIQHLTETVNKPIQRLADKKGDLADRKRQPDPATVGIGPLQERLVELNRDYESVRDSLLSLTQAQQQLAMTGTLLDSRFAGQKPLARDVTALRKNITQLGRRVDPAVTEGGRTETAYLGLIDVVNKRLTQLGPTAPVAETTRLVGALAALPQAPGKDALFPRDGASTAKTGLDKGGDRRGGALFAAVIKAWAAVEKKADESTLAALEKAAAQCVSFYESSKAPPNPVDTGRADKSRDALARVRKLRLANARAALPPPPWSEEQATEARRIEAVTLLDGGAQAKPPSAKGESDSFFLKDGSGKNAFIFKPKQGENVKEGGREGEGVAREVLSSKFNDQMKEMIGIDFGVCPTGLARLDSDSFAQGEKSQAKSRMGALQQTAPNDGNLTTLCGGDTEASKQIPVEDVQKIALLDFLTLQGDRNPDNILVRREGGTTRLTPIDGGFAFPDTKTFAVFGPGMGAEVKGGKTGQIQPGQNGLMQLPQSDQKFTPEILRAIERIDPAAMVKGMKQANAEMVQDAPELDGMVGDENLENMRRAAAFLKKAAPEFTVSELAEAYAGDMKKILALPAKQVDEAIGKLLETMAARRNFKKDVAEAEQTYNDLGGDVELKKLGWELLDPRLRIDWQRKIEILQRHIQAPEQPWTNPEKVESTPEQQRAQVYETLGGDRELAKVMKRPDAQYKPVVNATSPLLAKLIRLKVWDLYRRNGGDDAMRRLLALNEESRYARFDTLDKERKAAVATFARSSWNPEIAPLDTKAQVLSDFSHLQRGR